MLLLDEPLGALDLKLRENMQEELKTLQKSLGITFVFVTHDQGEALSMADRVAVFNDGRIMQIGAPEEIYSAPEHALRRRFRRLLQRAAARFRRAPRRTAPLGEPAAGEDRDRSKAGKASPGIVRVAHLPRRAPTGSPSRPRARASMSSCPPPGPLPAEGSIVALSWAPGDLHLMDEPA